MPPKVHNRIMPKVFLITGSLHPFFIKLVIEADDEAVLDSVGRGTQIAARPHRLLQDGFLAVSRRDKAQHLLALGNANGTGRLQQLPGRIPIKSGCLRIDNFIGPYLSFLKKLLSIFTGRSAFTQIGPVDLHACLLFICSYLEEEKVYPFAKKPGNGAGHSLGTMSSIGMRRIS